MGRKVVSKRLMVTLPDSVAQALEALADRQGRPTANLAAFILEASVREAAARGEVEVK